jgi:hypothetical protein
MTIEEELPLLNVHSSSTAPGPYHTIIVSCLNDSFALDNITPMPCKRKLYHHSQPMQQVVCL